MLTFVIPINYSIQFIYTMESNQTPVYKEQLKDLVSQIGEMLPEDALNIFNTDAARLAATYTDPLQLKVGDQAPLFSLSNARNEVIGLSDYLVKSSVVLVFYRGTWCPYCNLQLKLYQDILPELQEAGANLIAVSPQTPDNSLSIKEKNQLAFEVLSDPGNLVARKYTTVFKNGEAPIQAMKDLNIDFHAFYSDDSGELPVPAVFVIDQEGIVRFAKAESGDYRQRVEPQEILNTLKQLV